MGVPLVTFASETMASRVGVSLMNAVGGAEYIARTRQVKFTVEYFVVSFKNEILLLLQKM